MSKRKLSTMSALEILAMLSDEKKTAYDWQAAIQDLNYRGFNAREFRVFLETIEEDPDVLMEDLKVLLSILLRGSKISKIAQKTKAESWDKYKRTCEKFGVKDNIPVSGDSTNVVTLGRICNAYPEVSLFAMHHIPVRFEGIKSKLSKILRFAAGAALIPSTDQKMIDRHRKFCQDVDKILSRTTNLTAQKNLDTYWNASHNSDLFSDADRRQALGMFSVKTAEIQEDSSDSSTEDDQDDPDLPQTDFQWDNFRKSNKMHRM